MKPGIKKTRLIVGAAMLLGLTALCAETAGAQDSKKWEFRATGYFYLPSLDASTAFPTPVGSDINISADTLIRNTKFAVMGSFEAQKGRWGGFTDVMYFNVGKAETGVTQLAISGMPLPPGISADLDLDVKATIWTTAANFRAVTNRRITLDVYGGARMLDLRGKLDYTFNMDFGGFVGPVRTGSSEAQGDSWDGVGGVKGRLNLTSNGKWFVPFAADAGAGQSDLTWQAMGGIGYARERWEVVGGWRTVSYDMKSGKRIADLTFNGPMVGVTFRW